MPLKMTPTLPWKLGKLNINTTTLKNQSDLNIIEIIAVVSALLYIILVTRENSICFFFGLISSAIYIHIFIETKYYYDALINGYYVIMSVYGLILWSKKNDKELNISSLNRKSILFYLALGVLLTLAFGLIGKHVLKSSLPYLDAFTTVFSFIATYLVVQKKIENWLIWIVVDIIGIGMYWYKDLYPTAILFLIYTLITIVGYFSWKKKISIVN